ncbi:MAG: PD40 domain-containing protein [Anaerolineae bacterium]|nr:PD40 domain-containing protein [Anaerolineae bacterium]
MPEQSKLNSVCPYLGLTQDNSSHFSYPEASHCCLATENKASISLDHQGTFCFSSQYPTCSRYVDIPLEEVQAIAAKTSPRNEPQEGFFTKQKPLWISIIALLVLIGLGAIYFTQTTVQDGEAVTNLDQPVITLKTPTATSTPTVATNAETNPASGTSVFLATATSTTTPEPGNQIYNLSPDSISIGWVSSGEERGNNFGDSSLYAGKFEGKIYNGAFQFDLSSIPRGAPIYKASIQMTGLRDDRLGRKLDQPNGAAAWSLRLLAPEIDEDWNRHNYQTLANADVLQTLSPILGEKDLNTGQVNTFELSSAQIAILKQRLVDNENPTVSFRIDGPIVGEDSLFAWDTGYGPESEGNKVILSVEAGEPPATPPPYKYVLITSTPTPENIATAAVIALQITGEATDFGTATPLPANFVTPTPIPDYLIIVPTTTPENLATAGIMAQFATAEVVVNGTPTPIPTNAVTATPIPTETSTPVPTPVDYILITSTPTPESIFTAATMSAEATSLAQKFGTATPLPETWATPIVVTVTPTPLNAATSQAIASLATAIAFTTGTPPATPSNVVTATPTPVYERIALTVTPTPAPFNTLVEAVPSNLMGKILFKSDRESNLEPKEEFIYLYDPATDELGRLTASWPYIAARAREEWSADKRFRVFTKDATRYQEGNAEEVPAVFVYDYLYGKEEQITKFGLGIAYYGTWSPTSNQIIFVSNDSGDDEIWRFDYDDKSLLQLTESNAEFNGREIGKDTFVPELSKYPSWSPDGTQIVFTSTRTGNQQLWIMDANGANQRPLMGWDKLTTYNDYEPVWIKYFDPIQSTDY